MIYIAVSGASNSSDNPEIFPVSKFCSELSFSVLGKQLNLQLEHQFRVLRVVNDSFISAACNNLTIMAKLKSTCSMFWYEVTVPVWLLYKFKFREKT